MGRHVIKVADSQKALHTMKEQFLRKSSCKIEISYLSIILNCKKSSPKQGHLISHRAYFDVFHIDQQDALILPKIEQILATDEAKLKQFGESWQQSISKLTEFSRQIRSLGLVAPDYQLDVISIGKHNLPVLRITNTNQFLRDDIALFAPIKHYDVQNKRGKNHQLALDEHDWLTTLSDVARDINVLVQHQIKIPKKLFDLVLFKGEKKDVLRIFMTFDMPNSPYKKHSDRNQFFAGQQKQHFDADDLIKLYINYCCDSILENIKQHEGEDNALIGNQLRGLRRQIKQNLYEQVTTNVRNSL